MTRGYPKKHHEAIKIPLVHPNLRDATSFAMFGDPVPEKDPEMAALDVDPWASANFTKMRIQVLSWCSRQKLGGFQMDTIRV